jgi:hypothetical protein
MAFSSRELSVLAYANGFTLWHYRTADPAADLIAPDYFRAADELLRPGDQIVLTLTGAEPTVGAALVVTDVQPSGHVAVAPAGWPAVTTPEPCAKRDAAAERRMAAAC